MKVAIVGSRAFGACDCTPHFPPADEAEREHQKTCPRLRAWTLMLHAMTRLSKMDGFEGFVSGGAAGADTLAEEIADALHWTITVYRPESGPSPFWKRAMRRNQRIVDASDIVVAFFGPGERSRGTSDTVARAIAKGRGLHVYHEGRWTDR